MKAFRKTGFFFLSFFMLSGGFINAQEADKAGSNIAVETPPADTDQEKRKTMERKSEFLFAPLNSATLWTMGANESTDSVDLEKLEIAKKPTDPNADGFISPQANSVYFGVPPKSAASTVSLGVVGTDVDRFLSTTSFQESSYKSAFGYFSFDKDSLSTGVSRKFTNGMVTSLYYNGNIIEDIFAYISNNSLTNGKVGMGVTDTADSSDYDFLGDLKDRNNINSRSNIDLMFGGGSFGLNLGYSQKLFGLMKNSDPEIVMSGTDGIMKTGQDAVLDNALVPHLELGAASYSDSLIFKMALGLQLDIHSHRELFKGSTFTFPSYTPGTPTSNVTEEVTTRKLSADYLEPAMALRLEWEFPSDDVSALAFGFETGVRTKLYSNMDDRGQTVKGIFWSQNGPTNPISGTGTYTVGLTESSLNMDVLLRPSVRFITYVIERLRFGLSGGFGVAFKFNGTTTETYEYTDKATYLSASDPYDATYLVDTRTETPSVDLGLYPNLGFGFQFEIVPKVFSLNGGVGATQTLYRLRTGEIESNTGGTATKEPLLEQTWGKPLAQFALGATFAFKQACSIDALFSSNGTNFDNANFVLQFTAKF